MTEEVQTSRFTRRAFVVDAVQVTADNMERLSKWCGGAVRHTKPKPERSLPSSPYVLVPVFAPRNERQRRGYKGDWIIRAENGSFYVYADKAFNLAFEPFTENPESKLYITKS